MSRKAPKAKGVAMMARKTMNLLESVSLMKVRLRRVTDKYSVARGHAPPNSL